MKHFNNIKLALEEMVYSVKEYGIREKAGIWQATELFADQEMFVLRNQFFSIPAELDIPGVDKAWADEHFEERVGGEPTNPGESYKRWPYNTFTEGNDPYKDGKTFSHTYQERFWPKQAGPGPFGPNGIRYELGDLNDVIKQLEDNPLTRQAYLPIFFPEDTGAVHKQRVPCTLGYYFWIENGELHCNYIIRSCDVLRHFRNDVYLTMKLLVYVADKLTIKTGRLNFMAFNLHTFVNDQYALTRKENRIKNNTWEIQ